MVHITLKQLAEQVSLKYLHGIRCTSSEVRSSTREDLNILTS